MRFHAGIDREVAPLSPYLPALPRWITTLGDHLTLIQNRAYYFRKAAVNFRFEHFPVVKKEPYRGERVNIPAVSLLQHLPATAAVALQMRPLKGERAAV